MKNIILIFALLISTFAFSQDVLVKGSYGAYTGLVTDSIHGATSKYKTFQIFNTKPYYFDVQANIDSNTTSVGYFATSLWGSNDNVKYYQIGSTVNYYATVDTTVRFTNFIRFTNDTSGTGTIYQVNDKIATWRYLKVNLTGFGAAASCKIKTITVKVSAISEE